MSNEEFKKNTIEDIKTSLIDRLQNNYVDDSYLWECNMTIVNFILIHLATMSQKRYKIYKFNDYCQKNLEVFKECLKSATFDVFFPSDEEFFKLIVENNFNFELAKEKFMDKISNKMSSFLKELEDKTLKSAIVDKINLEENPELMQEIEKLLERTKMKNYE